MNAIAHRSVINDMAARFGQERSAFEATLKRTIMPSGAEASNEQVAAFLIVAKKYDLNPFTKEIYAFPARGGGIQPIVSVDGWTKIINSHPQLDGITFEDRLADDGKVSAVTCCIYRKDRSHPTTITEHMAECVRDTDTWKRWPMRMLRHKALIQCARVAFGFAGIIDPDEADRFIDAEVITSGKPVVAMPRSKSEAAVAQPAMEAAPASAQTDANAESFLRDMEAAEARQDATHAD